MTPLQLIQSLGSSRMNFDLSRMVRLMTSLGHPENSFPSIHIAGTNGKGSTATFIASVLKESGRKVGLYTSPHLIRINERFQINGKMISDRDLSRIARKIISLKGQKLTQFEMLTAIAFVWFAEQKIDVGVIEVGLGGRLDATNVMKNVLVSVITNIDLEHTQILGKTIRTIAGEKAGIIKPFVNVVTTATGEGSQEIKKQAKHKRSPFFIANLSRYDQKIISHIRLPGEHQKINAALALKAIRLLPYSISDRALVSGFRQAKWPGRFEKIKANKNRLLILDGAHNPAATKVLVDTLRQQKIKKTILIFGVLRDKNYDAMIRLLAPMTEKAFVVKVASDRSATGKDLRNIAQKFGNAEIQATLQNAWKMAVRERSTFPILITGSLYLIGEFKKLQEKK